MSSVVVVIGVRVMAIVVGACLLQACGSGGTEAEDIARDREAAAPPPTDGAGTVGYLRGLGAGAVAMHDAAVGRVAGGVDSADACRMDADRLNGVATPTQVLEQIAGVPDETLRAYLLDERSSLADVLAACVAGDRGGAAAALTQLAAASASTGRRLESLGWAP